MIDYELNGVGAVFGLTGENNMGQATNAVTGSLTREYGYDSYGFPTSRMVRRGTTTLQNFGYNIDSAAGNLNCRL